MLSAEQSARAEWIFGLILKSGLWAVVETFYRNI